MRTEADHEAFIRAQTRLAWAPLCPEITLDLATEITPIWQESEAFLDRLGIAPPYWAFAWPGSAALARYILDHPEQINGRRVVDFAAGAGLAGIAATLAGAASVLAIEIDPMAGAAIALNATQNGVSVMIDIGDRVFEPIEADLILCGDICYEAPMVRRIMPWLRRLALGSEVWLADPGRAYLPTAALDAFAEYNVPVTRELESCEHRMTRLYRVSS